MSQGSNWDVYPIRILLEVVESVLRCGTIIQVSFPHKCGQLNWCSALNVEVIVSFSRYFLFSLLAYLWYLPRCPVFWCKWPTEVFSRCIRSSGSSNDWSLHFPSSDLSPRGGSGLVWSLCLPSSDFSSRVGSRLVHQWAFSYPRTGPIGSMLCLDPSFPL